MAHVDRDGEGGAERRLVGRDHRAQVQTASVIGGERRADDAAAVTDDERHLFRGAERSGDDQVALVFAVIVVRDGDDLAASESLDGGGGGVMHVQSNRRRGRGVEKIVRRDRSQRLSHDPLGGFARKPRSVFAADERHGAGRDANAAGEIRARHLIAFEPVAELHGDQIRAGSVLRNSIWARARSVEARQP